MSKNKAYNFKCSCSNLLVVSEYTVEVFCRKCGSIYIRMCINKPPTYIKVGEQHIGVR